MSLPRPVEEPSANLLDRRYIHHLAGDPAALERSVARYVRTRRRREDREAAAQARADDAMTALGAALGIRLVRVGEVEDPPLPAPRKRAPRTPRPPA